MTSSLEDQNRSVETAAHGLWEIQEKIKEIEALKLTLMRDVGACQIYINLPSTDCNRLDQHGMMIIRTLASFKCAIETFSAESERLISEKGLILPCKK